MLTTYALFLTGVVREWGVLINLKLEGEGPLSVNRIVSSSTQAGSIDAKYMNTVV
jgi:hypothetical protein